jgi:hypothetical protein
MEALGIVEPEADQQLARTVYVPELPRVRDRQESAFRLFRLLLGADSCRSRDKENREEHVSVHLVAQGQFLSFCNQCRPKMVSNCAVMSQDDRHSP